MVCPSSCIKIDKGGIFIFFTNKLIRMTVAYVFITSALMKLMGTELTNHFLGLGLPYPHMMLKLVILIEIVCGILLLVNKAVKNAVVPLMGYDRSPSFNKGSLTAHRPSCISLLVLV